MGNHFLIDTDQVRTTSKAIKGDTDELRPKTGTYLGQIDETSKQLPALLYENSWAAILDIKAFLNRSMEERDRIHTLLEEVAKQVDKLDQELATLFQDLTNDPPPHK
jgi:hypothetical protein